MTRKTILPPRIISKGPDVGKKTVEGVLDDVAEGVDWFFVVTPEGWRFSFRAREFDGGMDWAKANIGKKVRITSVAEVLDEGAPIPCNPE